MFDVSSLEGVWAALPVPWAADGSVDPGLVAQLVHRYHAAGVNGAYTTGTDGEMHVLEWEDFCQLVDAFARAAAETGLPVQVGCTWSQTNGVLKRMRYAQERGIGCVQIALPSWVPLGEDEMRGFFAALRDGCPDLSLVHYNIARAGRFFAGKDYRAILDVAPNLVGTKHTGGDVGSLIEIVQATPELRHFVVDTQIVPGALFGAKGFYSFLVNLSPRFAIELWRDCVRGDWTEAARKRTVADAFFREWLGTSGLPTASPALAKIATRAGIFGKMPLGVREPYRSGTEAHVVALRGLLQEKYAEMV